MKRSPLDPTAYHRLATNSLWVGLCQASMVFAMALTIVGSRALGDAAFGQYVFLLAVTTVLGELAVLGTTDYASILIAREQPRAEIVLGNTLGLRIPLMLGFTLAVLTIVAVRTPEILLAGLLIALDWAARTVIHLLRGVLRARDAFPADARVGTLERLIVLILGATSVLHFRSLLAFATGILLGRLLALGLARRAVAAAGVAIRVRFQPAEWRRLLRGGVPIGIRGIFKGVSFRIDAIMLGVMRSAPEVGWYGAAYKFLEASFVFHEAVGVAVQPAISQAWGQGRRADLAEIFSRSYKVLQLVGAFLAALTFVYARPLVDHLYGAEYAASVDALRILAWTMLLSYSSLSCVFALDATDAGSRTVAPFALAAALNVLLNLAAIPTHGILGAAVTTLVTEGFVAAAMLVTVARRGLAVPASAMFGPGLAAGGFVLTALGATPWLGAWASLALGSAAFGFMAVATGVADELDRAYVRFLVRRWIPGSL